MKRLFNSRPKTAKPRAASPKRSANSKSAVSDSKRIEAPPAPAVRPDLDRWSQDIETLREAAKKLAQQRFGSGSGHAIAPYSPFHQITKSLDDPSAEVRQQAVKALYDLDPDRAASLFNVALRDGSPEERKELGAALAASGLIEDAINNLMAKNHKDCYSALSLLFLVAKAGEVEPLIKVIERQPSLELRLALITLLASTREPEVLPAFRRLALSNSLAAEVRLAVLEAIGHMTKSQESTSAAVSQ